MAFGTFTISALAAAIGVASFEALIIVILSVVHVRHRRKKEFEECMRRSNANRERFLDLY